MQVQSLARDDALEESMATHSSIFVCRIPWIEDPGGLQSMGSQRVRHNGSDLAHTLVESGRSWVPVLASPL